MAALKCKMCAGELIVSDDSRIAVCEYCGSKQTVPSIDNEKKLNLFSRANKLRFNCDFDKAFSVYESIVSEFSEEAEAYWGLILCTYGIEYVDDPATLKKIPTCHRTSFECVMDNPNFELVLENADVSSRSIYREEAKQIEELRKDIIEVSNKEEPYDIFICYKETDENGERTLDSVLAQDIYDELVKKGYRVFFSRITLEDKLGKEYEPYIFSALNSAKIMLVFGTNYEYFNAVWVKNEWSRFLQLISSGQKKTLIPCYKGIDAYDMPREFAKLQAQDLGKVGASQDLIRGIEKLISNESTNKSHQENDYTTSLKRAFMFLEDGEFKKAEKYFEQVLDLEPECAKAYLGKFMIENRIRTENCIASTPKNYDIESVNFKKAIKFSSEDTKQLLFDAIKKAKELYVKKYSSLWKQQEQFIKLRKRIACNSESCCFVLLNGNVIGCGGEITRKHPFYDYPCLSNINTVTKEVAALNNPFQQFFVCSTKSGQICELPKNAYNNGNLCHGNPYYTEDNNIIKVVAEYHHNAGLLSDGTVIARGCNKAGCCDVTTWKNIVDIDCGEFHTVGLKSDGTVVACGGKNHTGDSIFQDVEADYGQCNVSKWKDISSISCGTYTTFGVKKDGTVLACGDNRWNTCDCSSWENIVGVASSNSHTVGVMSDGTCVACGANDYGQCNVSGWTDIIVVACDNGYTIGIKKDGSIIATGSDKAGQFAITKFKFFIDEDDETSFYEEHKEIIPKSKVSSEKSSSGCYIATCVYGSYDCPPVWTLRRFRDNYLANSFLGRLFIKTYYSTSPKLVAWFGDSNWFKKTCKKPLDRLVAILKSKGYLETPYND